MQMDLYDTKGSTYPVPSAANSTPASEEDPGFFKKLMTLLSKANLPDSGSYAGRVDRAVRDTREEISERSRGSSPGMRVPSNGFKTPIADTYTKSPAEWAQEFPEGSGAAPSDVIPTAPTNVGQGGRKAPSTPKEALMKRRAGSEAADQVDVAARFERKVDDAYSEQMKALLKRVEGKGELDLTPLLALTDTWTGSQFARTYDRPMTEDERAKMALTIRANLKEHEDNLTYKREALKQQAAIAAGRREDQDLDRQTRVRVAQIGASARAATAGQKAEAAVPTKLAKDYRGTLETIARNENFNPKNPESKDWKGYTQQVHQDTLDAAKWAVDNGKAPDLQTAYGYILADRLASARQPKHQEE